MERLIYSELIAWKNHSERKPLLLKGVRQCGKTFLLREFGQREYEDVAWFNFEGNPSLLNCFRKDLDVHRILTELGVLRQKKIVPGQTLIIFDEIQFCNEALTSLKYFCENAPEYPIACAGSLLGVALSKPLSFPVGKVDMLTLRPMNFQEFLLAHGERMLYEHLKELGPKEEVPEAFSGKLENYLRSYLVVGGMPEVVKSWIDSADMERVEKLQQTILDNYELDFAKHAPGNEFTKLSLIWRAIPRQLACGNRKFIFSHVKEGMRARELEDALEWLNSAGLVHKVMAVAKPLLPLSLYANETYFKLYMSDVGLLRRMADLPAQSVFGESKAYPEFKGALAENYVLGELVSLQGRVPYCWKSGNQAEVDFVVQMGEDIVPIEVKSERNQRCRSLSVYRERYQSRVSVVTSMRNVSGAEVKLVPLYMLWKLPEYIQSLT